MALGYTTPQLVQRRTGKNLSSSQLQECVALIEVAEYWIHRYTGREWIYDGSPVTERHTVYGREIQLKRTPISSITSLTIRTMAPGSVPTALDSTQFELVDAERGIVSIAGYGSFHSWEGHIAARRRVYTVVYVPVAAATPPVVVTELATRLVAFWVGSGAGSALPDASGDIQSYSIGGDLSVTFRDSDKVLAVPANVLTMLSDLRPKRLLLA